MLTNKRNPTEIMKYMNKHAVGFLRQQTDYIWVNIHPALPLFQKQNVTTLV
ncbi:hypothetical protein U0035_21335 [Niabella yanshanensis]|uniref:Transposase n=1 Tax=Niabella yanshanensis TaxID=577386 RepID=A0ABZ0W6V3_9BACT|nr:hypothetical protein [Niabella yanshanensis]WQD38217.1 hypothetical protein U0035_21335 [Niabella yanshanensis]